MNNIRQDILHAFLCHTIRCSVGIQASYIPSRSQTIFITAPRLPRLMMRLVTYIDTHGKIIKETQKLNIHTSRRLLLQTIPCIFMSV